MDDSFEQQVAKMQARNRELAAHRDELARESDAEQRRIAHLAYLHEEQERLEREIAALEGRPYHDDDDGFVDAPEPPEPDDVNNT